jgi:magnesium-protoporphyrin O-methyltransferase
MIRASQYNQGQHDSREGDMSCCRQCEGIETMFGQDNARRELKDFLKNGPSKQTRLLLDEITKRGVDGLTLLDIGGGVGAIQHALAEAGATHITDVDASSAYLAVARSEAERRGYAERADHHFGNFIDLAPDIPPADVVTLDRVICCYHDMHTLVSLSAAKARKFYGFVYPIDAWWTRLASRAANFMLGLSSNPFRMFVHPQQSVESLLESEGLHKIFYRPVGLWQVVLYSR